MIPRALQKIIRYRLKSFPAVAILGPRQAGKTTLAKTFSALYYDLEIEEERLRLDIQWNELTGSKEVIILDEAQNFPAIFPRIRNAIDANRKRNGRFLLLGSVSPGLMKEVSESLAGRLAVCELSPVSVDELAPSKDEDLWFKGGFPDGGILGKNNFPHWQQNYLDLLAMRDLPLWGLTTRPQTTRRFFRMLAAVNGTIWNANQIGKSLGVSYHTVNSVLDYLEQAYLVRRLLPFFKNIKKRLVKSPKVYWRDSGLLHSLLNVSNKNDLLVQPWIGLSWEGWVIEQILVFLSTRDLPLADPCFFRTSDGYELDLLLNLSGQTYAIEIKLTSSPGRDDIQRLEKTADIAGAEKRILISKTIQPVEKENLISTNLRGFLKYLDTKIR